MVVVVVMEEGESVTGIQSVVIGHSVVGLGYKSRPGGINPPGFIMQCTNPSNIELGKRVPCGRCIACRINRGQEWSTRILHEMDKYRKGVFVTLTYNDENIPKGGTLVKAHLQGFIKRLRNKSELVRYYGVGEYGDLTDRPHYHIILISDAVDIASVWDYGFVYLGSVTWESINYVTSYVQKKLYGKKAKEVYGDRLAPFAVMSKGMGLSWLNENKDQVMLHLGVRRHGKTVMAPRYYMKKIGDEIPVDVWNRRAMIMAQKRDDFLAAEGVSELERSEKERNSRRQKELDLGWKSRNESPKGNF